MHMFSFLDDAGCLVTSKRHMSERSSNEADDINLSRVRKRKTTDWLTQTGIYRNLVMFSGY